jgi:hypothetical protein
MPNKILLSVTDESKIIIGLSNCDSHSIPESDAQSKVIISHC